MPTVCQRKSSCQEHEGCMQHFNTPAKRSVCECMRSCKESIQQASRHRASSNHGKACAL